jgi:hypothetical protein
MDRRREEHDPSVRFSAFTGAFADTSQRYAWGGGGS